MSEKYAKRIIRYTVDQDKVEDHEVTAAQQTVDDQEASEEQQTVADQLVTEIPQKGQTEN